MILSALKLRHALPIWLCLHCVSASAQDTASTTVQDPGVPLQEVKVVAYKTPERLPYQAFVRSMLAGERKRELAPRADIRFRVISHTGKDMGLSLVGVTARQDIALDSGGYFDLEKNLVDGGEDAYVVATASAGKARFEPVVRTPDLAAATHRMGDLRLQCEMQWAMIKEELPFIMRSTFQLGGGICHSRKIPMSFTADARLKSAVLVEGTRRFALTLSKDMQQYYAPVHDLGWSNEARVVLDFASALPPAQP